MNIELYFKKHNLFFYLLLLIIFTAPEFLHAKADLADIRFGKHKNFSRIVFDIDSVKKYQLKKLNDTVLEVRIYGDIEFNKDFYSPHSQYIRNVKIIRDKSLTICRISFIDSFYVKQHSTLSSPNRIVIDVIKNGHGNTNNYASNIRNINNYNLTLSKLPASSNEVSKNVEHNNTNELKFHQQTNLTENDLLLDNNSGLNYESNQNLGDSSNLEFLLPLIDNSENLEFKEYISGNETNYKHLGNFFALEINQKEKAYKTKDLEEFFNTWGFTKLTIIPNGLNGLIKAEAEIAYNPSDRNDFYETEILGLRQYSTGMKRLKIYGDWKGFDYGASYSRVEKVKKVPGFSLDDDQQGGELWVEKKYKIFKFRSYLSKYSDNVDRNPENEIKTIKKAGLKLNIKQENLPGFYVAYEKGLLYSSNESEGFNPKRDDITNISTGMYYSKANWNVNMDMYYSNFASKINLDSQSQFYYYYLSLNYSPSERLSIGPALSVSKEDYKWQGGGIEYLRPSASMWFKYNEFYRNLDLNGYLSYYKNLADDGFTDTNTFNGSLTVSWKNKKSNPVLERFSLRFAYLHYLDSIYTDSSYNDLSVLLNFHLASL